jgi:prevent-host-death family protein
MTVELSVSEARGHLADVIERARRDHEPTFITRHGRRVAAVISAEDLDRLYELAEDMADIRAAAQAREELERTEGEPVPWEQVKRDLGLI